MRRWANTLCAALFGSSMGAYATTGGRAVLVIAIVSLWLLGLTRST